MSTLETMPSIALLIVLANIALCLGGAGQQHAASQRAQPAIAAIAAASGARSNCNHQARLACEATSPRERPEAAD